MVIDLINGSHHSMTKEGCAVPVPVHGKRDLGEGLIAALQRQTNVKLQLQRLTYVHILASWKLNSIPIKPQRIRLNMKGVSFEEASVVLLDPYVLTREDVDAIGEARFFSLGMGARNRILLVVWTLRDERIRLISAWKAKQPQRRRYEQQF